MDGNAEAGGAAKGLVVNRLAAKALVDQLCKDLPNGLSPEAEDFDYGWFRQRVNSIAERCLPVDSIYVWQYALWCLDREGLLPVSYADALSRK